MAQLSALDVAEHILAKQGDMTAMKLQKLVYYCQAWALVWDGEALFHERIQAWKNGPVVWELFNAHRGKYLVTAGAIKPEPVPLAPEQAETVDAVLAEYGGRSAWFLSRLTHAEDPWREARKAAGLSDGDSGEPEITHAAMQMYYDALASPQPDSE